EGVSVHAIGTPLITNSDGTKFGKSEGNAIWLDAEMCSPYRFYQFWLNTDDADVIDRLKVFTFLTREEIEALDEQVPAAPFGPEATDAVIAASQALFGQGDLATLDAATLAAAVGELPHVQLPPSALVVQALADTGLTSSLSEARRAVAQGGVYLNNAKVDDEN